MNIEICEYVANKLSLKKFKSLHVIRHIADRKMISVRSGRLKGPNHPTIPGHIIAIGM